MIVRVSMKHPITKHKGWMTRRSRSLMRRVLFGLSAAPLMGNPLDDDRGDPSGVHLYVSAFTDCTMCDIAFPGDWSKAQVNAFIQFMKNAKDLTVDLISAPEPDTMPA